MTDSKRQVVYVAAYEDVTRALADPRMRSAVLVEVGKQAGTSGGRPSVVISGQAVPAGPSTITTAGQGPG